MTETEGIPLPAGPHAWLERFRRLPARRVDAALAVAVTAATVGPVLGAVSREWWVLPLAILASVPVLWRRRAPMRVSLVMGAATSVMVFWQAPLLPYGPLAGVYTIAALSPPLLRLVSIPVIGVTVYVSVALPHGGLDVYRTMGTAFVAAYALGTGTRARRARAAELAERSCRLAQERAAAAALERARIARDVHDIVTHSVGLIVVPAEAGPVVLHSDRQRAEAAFDAIADTGRGALVQLRGLVGALRSAGEQPGLGTLGDLVARTARAGLEVTLTDEGAPRPVPPAVGAAAYRIVQEALTNVLRHAAGARTAAVRLCWGATVLRVEIADDGAGRRAGTAAGHGLTGMRERAAACGGTLRAGPGDEGFLVVATLPIGS